MSQNHKPIRQMDTHLFLKRLKMSNTAIDPKKILAKVVGNLYKVHKDLDDLALLDTNLVDLILLRASQINGCAYCINMHLAEARNHGETQQRLDRLLVWKQSPDFTVAERAALSWLEALTLLNPNTDYQPLRDHLLQSFNEEQISALTILVGMINLWNRVQISQH